MSKEDLPNVVIVGVGGAGSRAAYQLSTRLDFAKYNLIVVNPRPYTILYPATARVIVSDRDNIQERIFVPIESILKGKGRLVLGKVTKVEESGNGGTVTISNGDTISYSALILSPGVSWDHPLGFPEGANTLDAYLTSNREAIRKAKKIVIVGAGAVGCELAGEIRDVSSDKQITLVHGDTLPLNSFYPAKFRIATQKNFEKRNIQFVLGEYIDKIPSLDDDITEVKTRSGKTIEADLVISARGQRPSTELITDSFGASALTSRGLVRVEPTFQLPGHQPIFVVGDVIDWDEQKQVFKAQAHADIAVQNVLSFLGGQQKLKKYTGTWELLFLTNGRNGGVTYINVFGGITFGDWVTRVAKSKSLIISIMRGHIGL